MIIRMLWVCAVLGERGWWHHRRGITRRDTSVPLWRSAQTYGRHERHTRGGVGIGGEADHLLPSPSMARAQCCSHQCGLQPPLAHPR